MALLVGCVALFTDMLVYGIAIPVLPLLPATVDAGPAATGVLFAVYALAMIVATPVAGRLVDRVGSRRPLLVALLGLAASTLLFAVGGPFALLVVARVLQGLAAGMAWVASLSLIAANTPVADRGRSMGLAMSMVSVGVLVGPPLAGALVDAFGPRAPFLAATAVALLDGVLRVTLLRSDPPQIGPTAGPGAVMRVRGSGSVLTVVLVGAATLAVIGPVLPVHLASDQGLGPAAVGLLFALLVLSGAVLNPVVGGLVGRVDARLLTGFGGGLAVVALAGLGLAGVTWQVAVCMAVLGASNAFLLAPATTLIGHQGMRASPPALGAAYAAFNLAYAAGLVVGPLLGGGLTDAGGFRTAVTAVAALVVLATVTGLLRLPGGKSSTRRSMSSDTPSGSI
ncbi:MFS transporter [Pseudonocardia sp. HH130630-07]|uniref:MFS transporter n=1 Tax=Pseudonocardia sp. HH130630-07 TaxID=1690815 RepID=UPI0018D2CE06|nr:MFS transporter [Pseudonocardia sp. HH130630-07]